MSLQSQGPSQSRCTPGQKSQQPRRGSQPPGAGTSQRGSEPSSSRDAPVGSGPRSSRDAPVGSGPRSRGAQTGIRVISVGAARWGLTSHLHSPQEQGHPSRDQSQGAAGVPRRGHRQQEQLCSRQGSQPGSGWTSSSGGTGMAQIGAPARGTRWPRQDPRWVCRQVCAGPLGRRAGEASCPTTSSPRPLGVSGPVRGSSGTQERC